MINATEITEIIHSTQKRKRWTAFEKQQIVNEPLYLSIAWVFLPIVITHSCSTVISDSRLIVITYYRLIVITFP